VALRTRPTPKTNIFIHLVADMVLDHCADDYGADMSFAGQGEEELREYVAELTTRQMNSESFHLEPEQVLPSLKS
jgi:hypothetical protein